MRNKLAKRLKREVMHKMYLGDGVTESDLKKDRKSVFASSDFKSVYRARKKKEVNPLHSTVENHFPSKPGKKFPGRQKK